jgi:hypothetical protein
MKIEGIIFNNIYKENNIIDNLNNINFMNSIDKINIDKINITRPKLRTELYKYIQRSRL